MDKNSSNVTVHLPEEDLQKLDKGESVRMLQTHLQQIGYDVKINQDFDDETVWALTDLQLQCDQLLVSGMYDAETKVMIEHILNDEETIQPGAGLVKQEQQKTDDGPAIIENPYDVLALINKKNALPADYEPDDLIFPDVPFPFKQAFARKQLRIVAARALENMFAAADEAQLDLIALSGYRSYDRQDVIFAGNAKRHGEKAANNFSARPGESEHQSGLAMDVTTPAVDNKLVIKFGETKEGIWIKKHASRFGFIIRYPKGKENMTQYQYEPWHLRYVGEKSAQIIMSKEIILEEYMGVL